MQELAEIGEERKAEIHLSILDHNTHYNSHIQLGARIKI
jgi:hypothetical protein